MPDQDKHIGVIRTISSTRVVVRLDESITSLERELNGKLYRIGQIGAFVVMPMGGIDVVGVVAEMHMAAPNHASPSAAAGAREAMEMELQLIGSVVNGRFEKGIASFPLLGGDAYMTDESDVTTLFSSYAHFGFAVGDISGFQGERQYIDPNRFFGKHIALLGSTGSGKSTAVTSIIQKVQMFSNTHVIMLDIHNEYAAAFRDFGNLINITELELPYWFMNFEEMREMLIDENEPSAQSQIMLLKDLVLNSKREKNGTMEDYLTIDAPVYFDLNEVRAKLQFYDTERIQGFGGTPAREGPFYGAFTRMLVRLDSRMTDKRYEFMFKPQKYRDSDAITSIITRILGLDNKKQITVLDLSGVPFDIVNTIVSLLARTIFDFNFWNQNKADFPILLLFEEAHNYLPNNPTPNNRAARKTVERIAKEGRKYGVSCMIVSQRPSELSETILSQCNNFITLRLSNPTDQGYIKRLVPDSFTGMLDILPSLRQGEAMIIGDATALPARVIFDFPAPPPNSSDIRFYDKWVEAETETDVRTVVNRWWKQDRS